MTVKHFSYSLCLLPSENSINRNHRLPNINYGQGSLGKTASNFPITSAKMLWIFSQVNQKKLEFYGHDNIRVEKNWGWCGWRNSNSAFYRWNWLESITYSLEIHWANLAKGAEKGSFKAKAMLRCLIFVLIALSIQTNRFLPVHRSHIVKILPWNRTKIVQLKSNLSALGHPKINSTSKKWNHQEETCEFKNKFAHSFRCARERMLQEIIIMHLSSDVQLAILFEKRN